MQESGYIAKILLPDGAKNIQLGDNVAILVSEESMVGKFKDYKAGAAAPSETKAEPK